MKTIAVAEFKAKCLAIIKDVAQTHETFIVTKRGKPMAKLIPFDTKNCMKTKPLKGAATYIGDIISPIDEEWEATK